MNNDISRLIRDAIRESLTEAAMKIEPGSVHEMVLLATEYGGGQHVGGIMFYDTVLEGILKFVKDKLPQSTEKEIRDATKELIASGHVKEVRHPAGPMVYILSPKGKSRMKKSQLYITRYK
jgi:hypothetical protein